MLPATTQASRDTSKRKSSQLSRKHPGTPKEEGRGRKERKRERERESEREREGERQRERKTERGVPEYSIQEHPRRQRRKGEGGGRGLSSRQVPTNLKNASVALTTLGR